jgi:hypothetical protein
VLHHMLKSCHSLCAQIFCIKGIHTVSVSIFLCFLLKTVTYCKIMIENFQLYMGLIRYVSSLCVPHQDEAIFETLGSR